MHHMYKTRMTFLTVYILNVSSFSDASIFLILSATTESAGFTCIPADMQVLRQLHDALCCYSVVHRVYWWASTKKQRSSNVYPFQKCSVFPSWERECGHVFVKKFSPVSENKQLSYILNT